MKTYRSRTAKHTAIVTGRYVESDRPTNDIDDRERLVLRITRAIARLEAKRRQLKTKLKQVGEDLKAQRRGLRVALQQGEAIEIVGPEVAGKLDPARKRDRIIENTFHFRTKEPVDRRED